MGSRVTLASAVIGAPSDPKATGSVLPFKAKPAAASGLGKARRESFREVGIESPAEGTDRPPGRKRVAKPVPAADLATGDDLPNHVVSLAGRDFRRQFYCQKICKIFLASLEISRNLRHAN